MASHSDWNERFRYSDALRAGDLVFCSGQVGLDRDGNAPSAPAEQFRLAFDALRAVLAGAGCAPGDVVDLTSFHVDYPQNMAEFMDAKADFQGDARPAWTAVGVERLGTSETLVEVKAIARAAQS